MTKTKDQSVKEAEPETERETKTEAESHVAVGARGLAAPPTPPTPEQRQQACQAEVFAVLQRHGCEMTAWITMERVGNIGQKVLSVAMWGIVPSQQTQQPHP